MKKIVLIVLGVVVAALVLLLGIAATRPSHYHIERSATIAAAPATVFGLVNDLHRFPDWSPWQKLDPAMKITYGGPATGVGSGYYWLGNKQAGEGRMTITESTPDALVGMKLEFIKPFASVASTRLAFVPVEGGTRVGWAMDGENDLMSKVFCLFMDMDKMVGKDFEDGLANLARIAVAAGAAGEAATADTTAAPDSSAAAAKP